MPNDDFTPLGHDQAAPFSDETAQILANALQTVGPTSTDSRKREHQYSPGSDSVSTLTQSVDDNGSGNALKKARVDESSSGFNDAAEVSTTATVVSNATASGVDDLQEQVQSLRQEVQRLTQAQQPACYHYPYTPFGTTPPPYHWNQQQFGGHYTMNPPFGTSLPISGDGGSHAGANSPRQQQPPAHPGDKQQQQRNESTLDGKSGSTLANPYAPTSEHSRTASSNQQQPRDSEAAEAASKLVSDLERKCGRCPNPDCEGFCGILKKVGRGTSGCYQCGQPGHVKWARDGENVKKCPCNLYAAFRNKACFRCLMWGKLLKSSNNPELKNNPEKACSCRMKDRLKAEMILLWRGQDNYTSENDGSGFLAFLKVAYADKQSFNQTLAKIAAGKPSS